MRNLIVLMILFVITFSLCSSEHQPHPTNFWKNYIQCFDMLGEFSVLERVGIIIDEKDLLIDLSELDNISDPINSPNVYSVDDGILLSLDLFGPSYCSNTGDDKRLKYEEISNSINDNSFNQYIPWGTSSRAIYEKLKSIRIFTNQQYNQAFSAGDDISDLFTILFEDPYAFIENDYKVPIGYFTYAKDDLTKVLRLINLSCFDMSHSPIIGPNIYCILHTALDLTGNYSFRVEVYNNEGKSITVNSSLIKLEGVN